METRTDGARIRYGVVRGFEKEQGVRYERITVARNVNFNFNFHFRYIGDLPSVTVPFRPDGSTVDLFSELSRLANVKSAPRHPLRILRRHL